MTIAKLDRSVIEDMISGGEVRFRSADPYQSQAGYDQAGRGYELLAEQTEDMTLAMACRLAGQFYRREAARIRWEHRIPSLLPRSEVTLIGLGTCRWCGRPWQVSTDGACERCPEPLFGVAAPDAERAATWPAGDPVDLTAQPPMQD
ncbi:hypothetical protein [Nocardia cyriacigeorgica]|uniref:hypothetical protein n=1 Tax=Nocardia cyriacigeorgica TaxID=135487 RepID=UPI0024569C92|nr:hypothetical protein [Nocardia cyriacigeorgica]